MVIDHTYLPYTAEELLGHFIPTGTPAEIAEAEKQLAHYLKSARTYHEFLAQYSDRRGIPISVSRRLAQIEKDERFWVVTTLMRLFRANDDRRALSSLLEAAFPGAPAEGSWLRALQGDLRLYFEVNLPAPEAYKTDLRADVMSRQPIPYIRHAALKPGTDEVRANLEGTTKVDALLVNADSGLVILIEAKALSDASCSISFDPRRNQIARNVDVMLEPAGAEARAPLSLRNPNDSWFLLLTPEVFRQHPRSRLYGWLMSEYRERPESLAEDLRHRANVDWNAVCRRLGWTTFEDCERALPGACPWLVSDSAPRTGC